MARELLERARWPDGPICPHCVVVGGHCRVNPRTGSRKPVRQGVWKCRDCTNQFTVTVGTVFQGSKIPPTRWVTAIYLMGDSAKGLKLLQLHRRLGLTYRSARLLVKRLGSGMRQGALGKKLNSLLEAEGAKVVGRNPTKRLLHAKKRAGVLSVGEGKGISGPGVLERRRVKSGRDEEREPGGSLQGCQERTFRLSRCFDCKPITDPSGRRVIDTSSPVKRTGIPQVLNQTGLLLPVDVTSPLNFLVRLLNSTSSGC